MTVVADASPLIALAQVDQLPLLEKLFGEILVPPAVAREVELSLPAFVRERKLSRNRFRISPDLYEWLLSETGEGAPPQ